MKWTPLPAAMTSVLVSLCLAPTGSGATTTVLHSESVSGDLGQGAAAPALVAVLDQNVVDGTVTWTPALLDNDAFKFTVAAGQTASNFSFSFTNTSLISPEQVGGDVFLYSGTLGQPGLALISDSPYLVRAAGSPFGGSTPSPLALSTLGSPLGAGQYSLSIDLNGRSPNGGSVPYVLTFDVSPVPEAGVLAMMLAGLGLLGAAVRRGRPDRRACGVTRNRD